MVAWTTATAMRATSVPKIQPCLLLPIPANTAGSRQELSRVTLVMEGFMTLYGSGWFSSAELSFTIKTSPRFFFYKGSTQVSLRDCTRMTWIVSHYSTQRFRICLHLMMVHINSYTNVYRLYQGKTANSVQPQFPFLYSVILGTYNRQLKWYRNNPYNPF